MRLVVLTILTFLTTLSCSFGSVDSLIPYPAKVTIDKGYVPADAPVATTTDKSHTDLGSQGYILSCTPKGYHITAATDAGIFYGKLTLDQMRASGRIPCCEIRDIPAMKMRGVMFDLARLKEKHEYYYHMIDQLSKWKINTVFLHLTDGGGCAVEIKRYPSMATAFAFSQEDMKKLIKYAQERHVELIPEIESWGHAGYILRLPEFADLAEDKASPQTLCTSNPKVWEVLDAIYTEIAQLFPSEYIHAGCDESSFGKCPQCRAKIGSTSTDTLVAEHSGKVCSLVKSKGKIPMIWGDVLLHSRPAIDSLPKDTVICYWNYKAIVGPEPAEFLRSKGFTTLGCPALVWGGRIMLPKSDTLDNIQSFAGVVLDNNCLGMETTVWVPQRYIADTLPFGLAWTSELSWSGNHHSKLDFSRAFIRNYFGLEPNTELAQTLWNVHDLAFSTGSLFTNLWNYTGQLQKLSTPDLLRYTIPGRDQAKAIDLALLRYQPGVTRHREEYDALVLSADVAAHVGERAVGAARLTSYLNKAKTLSLGGNVDLAQSQLTQAIDMLDDQIAEENALHNRLDSDWNRWRYENDPMKASGGQNLLGYFIDADFYMKSISAQLKITQERLSRGEEVDWAAILKRP